MTVLITSYSESMESDESLELFFPPTRRTCGYQYLMRDEAVNFSRLARSERKYDTRMFLAIINLTYQKMHIAPAGMILKRRIGRMDIQLPQLKNKCPTFLVYILPCTDLLRILASHHTHRYRSRIESQSFKSNLHPPCICTHSLYLRSLPSQVYTSLSIHSLIVSLFLCFGNGYMLLMWSRMSIY
ncbi:hypothetical protein BDR04DRAFT_1102304 [Suillus decipiens]|nr:hypothetical protein BDR04DRAFT_1102304 [Suillus decipiens]